MRVDHKTLTHRLLCLAALEYSAMKGESADPVALAACFQRFEDLHHQMNRLVMGGSWS